MARSAATLVRKRRLTRSCYRWQRGCFIGNEISCCSPVTAELADGSSGDDRRSVVVADAGHADRSYLLPTTNAQRPPKHAVRRAYDRPIARRGKARA
eukprot:5831079-Prymnesium_polylepis.1